MGEAGGEHPRLAGAGAGEHQHGAVQRLHGVALFLVEAGEVVGHGPGIERLANAAELPFRNGFGRAIRRA